MPAELPSTEQIFTETGRLVPLAQAEPAELTIQIRRQHFISICTFDHSDLLFFGKRKHHSIHHPG